MITNIDKLQAALAKAIAEEDFVGNSSKVNKAIEALTPKSHVTATFKRLQLNARKDFLDNLDSGKAGYTDLTRADKIKDYVYDKFKSYMENPKTAAEASKLFNAAYSVTTVPSDPPPADGSADDSQEDA